MSKRVLPLFAAFALVFAAGCGDDEGAETEDTTSTTVETTTSTTEAEALALDDWVEEADDICADADDAIDDLPGDTAEEAAETIPDAIEIAEGQLEDIQALSLPDEEAEAVEEVLALLEDQLDVIEGMQDAIDAGDDAETVFEDAATDSEDIIADLDELADDLGLEACGSDDGSETTTTGGSGDEPFTYGDDPELDALWDACDEGDAEACDELWSQSPADSEYEQFGYSCGGIVPEGEAEICSEVLNAGGSGDIPATGDPVIDTMLEACLGGNGVACDQAYALTEPGSEAETFADTCGGTTDAGTICSPELGGSKVIEPEYSTGVSYGDDPELDGMQDACEDGDMAQCDLLYLLSPIGSEYELFGATCAGAFTSEEAPYSCVAGE